MQELWCFSPLILLTLIILKMWVFYKSLFIFVETLFFNPIDTKWETIWHYIMFQRALPKHGKGLPFIRATLNFHLEFLSLKGFWIILFFCTAFIVLSGFCLYVFVHAHVYVYVCVHTFFVLSFPLLTSPMQLLTNSRFFSFNYWEISKDFPGKLSASSQLL